VITSVPHPQDHNGVIPRLDWGKWYLKIWEKPLRADLV
jgi:hypothetical protein